MMTGSASRASVLPSAERLFHARQDFGQDDFEIGRREIAVGDTVGGNQVGAQIAVDPGPGGLGIFARDRPGKGKWHRVLHQNRVDQAGKGPHCAAASPAVGGRSGRFNVIGGLGH
jgi:hypothetical protein